MAGTDGEFLRKATEEMSSLAIRGQHVAFSLMAINNITSEHNSTLNSIVSKLFALVGVANILRDHLRTGSRDEDPDVPLLSWDQIKDLPELLQAWDAALINVEPIITDLDSQIYSKFAQALICTFPEMAMANALVRIAGCLKGFALLVSMAMSEQLQRLSSGSRLDGDNLETSVRNERHRLLKATERLRHQSDLTSVLGAGPPLLQPHGFGGGLFGGLFGGQSRNSAPVGINPSQGPNFVDVIQLQHPRGFRGRYGEPDYPYMDKKSSVQLNPPENGLKLDKSFEESELERYELSRKGQYPDPSMFENWPPAFDKHTVQGHQIQEMLKRLDSKAPVAETAGTGFGHATKEAISMPRINREASIDTQSEFEVLSHSEAGVNTPGTTRDSTPVPESNIKKDVKEAVKEDLSHQGQKTPTPSTNATPDSSEPQKIKEEGVARAEDVESNEVLEAYTLIPHAEHIRDVVEWSAKILKLPLGSDQVESHVRGLGEGYSVIDTIATLSPEEWRTIRAYTTPRGGTVVSIKRSHNVTVPTMFGSFDVPSLIFVIKIDKERSKLPFGNYKPPLTTGPGGLFGNSQRPTQPGGLFGTNNNEEEWEATRRSEWDHYYESLFPTRKSGGLFGQSLGTSQPATQTGVSDTGRTGGGFGVPQCTGSLFGNPSNAQSSPFSGFTNAQPSLFTSFNNAKASLFGNPQSSQNGTADTGPSTSNPQPSPFSRFSNAQPVTQQTGGLFGSSSGGNPQHLPRTNGLFGTSQRGPKGPLPNLTDRTTAQTSPASGGLFSFAGPPASTSTVSGSTFGPVSRTEEKEKNEIDANPTTGGLFASSEGPTTTNITHGGFIIGDSPTKDAKSTATTGFSFPDTSHQLATTTSTSDGGLFATIATDSDKDEKLATTTNLSSANSSSGGLLSVAGPHAAVREESGAPTASTLLETTPQKPQHKPWAFGSPSMPVAKTPKPFGTSPSSGPFAQYAGASSPFAGSSPTPPTSVLTGQLGSTTQKQSFGLFGGFSSSSAAAAATITTASVSAQPETQKDPSQDTFGLPEGLKNLSDEDRRLLAFTRKMAPYIGRFSSLSDKEFEEVLAVTDEFKKECSKEVRDSVFGTKE